MALPLASSGSASPPGGLAPSLPATAPSMVATAPARPFDLNSVVAGTWRAFPFSLFLGLAPAPIPLDIEGDEVDGEVAADLVHIRGRARVTSEGREIAAPDITANLKTKAVSARGGVVVTGDGRRLEGERAEGNLQERKVAVDGNVLFTTVLEVPNPKVGPRALPVSVRAQHIDYDFLHGTGSADAVETEALGVRFRGDSAIMGADGRMELTGADLTACPAGEEGTYSYHMHARTIEVVPDRGATARRATLYIGRRKITTVSRFHVHSGQAGATAHLPLPRIAASRLSGTYLSFALQPALFGGAAVADTRLELTTRVGARVFTTLRSSGGGPNPFFRVYLKEEVEGRDPSRLLIDRLPEVGFLLDDDSDSRWNRWVHGEVSFGYLRQHAPSRQTGRAQLTLMGQPIPLRTWGPWRLSARPGLHLAAYSTEDRYRDLNGEIDLARRWGPRRDARVAFIRHFSGGSTPFRFDEALIQTELATRTRWSSGPWSFGVDTRYDLDRGQLFDAQLRLGHAIRCIEPRIVYRYRLREIGFEISLVGLGDTSDLPPAGSVPAPVTRPLPAVPAACGACASVAPAPCRECAEASPAACEDCVTDAGSARTRSGG